MKIDIETLGLVHSALGEAIDCYNSHIDAHCSWEREQDEIDPNKVHMKQVVMNEHVKLVQSYRKRIRKWKRLLHDVKGDMAMLRKHGFCQLD